MTALTILCAGIWYEERHRGWMALIHTGRHGYPADFVFLSSILYGAMPFSYQDLRQSPIDQRSHIPQRQNRFFCLYRIQNNVARQGLPTGQLSFWFLNWIWRQWMLLPLMQLQVVRPGLIFQFQPASFRYTARHQRPH